MTGVILIGQRYPSLTDEDRLDPSDNSMCPFILIKKENCFCRVSEVNGAFGMDYSLL